MPLKILADDKPYMYFLRKNILEWSPLVFSPLWLEPRSGHMWESQVLLKDGQVVFPQVLRFSARFK